MTSADVTQPGRGWRIGVWVLTLIAALAFSGAGFMKLTGAEAMVQAFAGWGLPTWFMRFVGIGEFVGAIGILIPPIATLAALGLATITVGALVTHALHDPISAMIGALVLLVISLAIAYLRLGDFSRAVQRAAIFLPAPWLLHGLPLPQQGDLSTKGQGDKSTQDQGDKSTEHAKDGP